MGVFLGHFLNLSGARVTFLVRSHRVASLSKPQVIYSYQTHTTHTFSDFSIISDLKDVAKSDYDFVIVTLDGHHVKTSDGLATLKSIGDAIRDKDTPLIAGFIGLNTVKHYVETTGLPSNRIIQALLWTLVHEVRPAKLPLIPPTNGALLEGSDYAFRLIVMDPSLEDAKVPSLHILTDHQTDDIKRFMDLYASNGLVTSDAVPPAQIHAEIEPSFAFLLGWGLQGWAPAPELSKDEETWELTVDAIKELQGLFGELGAAAQAKTTPEGFAAGQVWFEQALLPISYAKFNQYHHGGKVRAQDVERVEEMIEELEKVGKPTTASKLLVSRFKALQ
jgi:hypothetical protein